MATYGITDTGFSRKDLTAVLADLNARVQGVFGSGINISAQSPQGQINGIFAEAEANLWEAIQAAYDSFNPQAAAGVVLSNLVTLNGISRLPATQSTVTLSFTGVNGTVIPSGTLFATNAGTQWATTANATISGGTATAPAQAVDFGPVSASSNTITTIVSAIAGLDTVTNVSAASTGTDVETDEDLRIRRAQSVAFASQSLVDSLFSGTANVSGVTQSIVLENDTDAVDANGLQPHSIHVIAEGGADADIANQIYLRKAVGIYTNGSTSTTVNDSQGIAHVISFSRPTVIPIQVVVNITKSSLFPADGSDRIKAAIESYFDGTFTPDYKQRIGDEVRWSRLFTPINSVPGHYVTSMTIACSALSIPAGTADITISILQRAEITAADVTVNVS